MSADTTGRIVSGLREAAAHARGQRPLGRETVINVPNDINVRAIRERLRLSQQEFAIRFGFSLGTLRHWEQGQRRPEGPARTLLRVIDRNPRAVERALAAS